MRKWLLLVVVVAVVAVPSSFTVAAVPAAEPTPTPPKPTWTPGPAPDKAPLMPDGSEPVGGLLTLHIQFLQEGLGVPWQGLWTTVQWCDDFGGWHDVEGWQGPLDEVTGSEGRKTWWFGSASCGAGPFRWVIWSGRGGQRLATSDPFYLSPSHEGGTVQVIVSLGSLAEPPLLPLAGGMDLRPWLALGGGLIVAGVMVALVVRVRAGCRPR